VAEPWKKIVIHELIEYDFDDLFNHTTSHNRAVGGGISMLNWANGVVFHIVFFPDTETIIKEKLSGIIHWSSVIFALKEKFEKRIVRDHGSVYLSDVSVNKTFQKLGEWLKSQSKMAKKQSVTF
jgi:hypothetical protein